MESIRKFLLSSKWVLLALVLFTITLLQHQKNKAEEELQRKESLVFSFNSNDVQKITIKNLNRNVFIAEFKNHQWRVLHPVEDFADFFRMDDFLNRILNQQAQKVLSQDISWSEYDLSPPFSTFEIQTRNEKKEIGISSDPNYDGQFYIKDNNTLWVGSPDWERFSQGSFNDYVSKKMLHSFEQPIRITYKTSKVQYEFKKNKDQWEWVGKKQFTLSQKAIEDWLGLLKKDTISQWANNKKSQSEKKNSDADIFVQLFFEGSSTPWFLKLLLISEAQDQVIISDRPYVYELKDKHGLNDVNFKEIPPQKTK